MSEKLQVAFLGTGRMGRELVTRLLAANAYEVTVWDRTSAKSIGFINQGALFALTPDAAVAEADIVITCLFGPMAVREVMLSDDLPSLSGTTWMDVSTVGPAMARECAAWAAGQGAAYVQAPVLGSLGPARAGQLGVLIGSAYAAARAQARAISSLWADADRIIEYDDPAKAATGKLLVNYGLAVGMQALIEACKIGQAGGLTAEEAVTLAQLPKTPLSIIAGMKGNALLTSDYTDTQFSTSLLAKDVNLMFTTGSGAALPALDVARATLHRAMQAGHGEDDFSSMADE